MVVGFVVSVFVSQQMHAKRGAFYDNKARETRVYMPWLGIDKFWADVSWLRCINALGRARKKMDNNMVKYFYGQFERITDLDPDFMPVYNVGVSFIAYEKPEKALGLMDKAEKLANKPDWHVPYQAAHWVLQIYARKEKDEAKKKEHYSRAIEYLNKAIKIGGVPWYVENMLLHTTAKKDGVYGEALPELQAWHRYYKQRYAKARATMADTGAGGPEGKAAAPEAGMEMDMEADPVIERLRTRIKSRCLDLMKSLIADEKKATGNAKRKLMADQATVRGIFKDVNPAGHYAPRSLVAYDAGDLFDRATGDPVTPYGIDLYDYEVNGRITLAKGGFNTFTGKPVASTFAQLKKMLNGKPIRRLAAHVPGKAGK